MTNVATITITEKVRPARTKAGKKVLVHMGHVGPSVGGFVCEYEDGSMSELLQKDFQFLDSKELFDEFCWEVKADD